MLRVLVAFSVEPDAMTSVVIVSGEISFSLGREKGVIGSTYGHCFFTFQTCYGISYSIRGVRRHTMGCKSQLVCIDLPVKMFFILHACDAQHVQYVRINTCICLFLFWCSDLLILPASPCLYLAVEIILMGVKYLLRYGDGA